LQNKEFNTAECHTEPVTKGQNNSFKIVLLNSKFYSRVQP